MNIRQIKAIVDYAEWAGSKWKNKLKVDWMRAGSEWDGDYALLQQVRNEQGPGWLTKVDLDVLQQGVGR